MQFQKHVNEGQISDTSKSKLQQAETLSLHVEGDDGLEGFVTDGQAYDCDDAEEDLHNQQISGKGYLQLLLLYESRLFLLTIFRFGYLY